ncbi:Oidioi.mRNA.OKI2018_I69.chr1.g2684.t1.cds [Oikopleura dioica]|uniref:Oidioi.mRNA.OKI2018_I69.chr1.g2684.t1.cds n=1 Tax=Oikopleura dioica TaxID=34765 RepID=A0ABN7SX43_OIKDI|nr:Oidioi.mRNA.OKI2018_I69.chr1.g2684.t1.cds [Oikopleura dioica]
MENLFGGKTPAFLFAGIMPTSCIDGDNEGESISLTRNDLLSFDLAINGSSCTGYPMKIKADFPIEPYLKYQDVMGNLMNVKTYKVDSIFDFKKAFLFAHKFEGENEENSGWVSATLEFKDVVDKNLSLVVWTIDMVKVSIDEYGQIDKDIVKKISSA